MAILPTLLHSQVSMSIVVSFSEAPDNATAIIAPLKYNKDFALSMQIDDGGETIYTHAYPYFNGGNIGAQSYPGLSFTDGCGNNIYFKMSSAQFSFNGNNENGPDTHIPGSGYGQVTWPQMDEIYNSGWGIYNHGVNGNAENSSDFMNYSIKRNESYTRRQLYNTTETGVRTRVHVNPNGQTPWTQVAFDLDYLAVLNQDNASSFMGDRGGNVNSSSVDWSQPQTLYRLHNSAVSVPNFVNGLADSSVNNANYWGVLFSHSIGSEYPIGSFISDFAIIEANYGSGGADNILMTTDEEILNYLIIRDALNINSVLVGSSLFITLNGTVPDDLRYYASTLVINANKNISNITVTGADSTNHTAYGSPDGLINLFWEGETIIPTVILADSFTTIAATSNQQRDAWIAMDYVMTLENNNHKDSLRTLLCDIPGTTYDDGFCDCIVDLGPDIDQCGGECHELSAPVGFDTYEWMVADTLYSEQQSITVCPTDTTQYILIAENDICIAIDTIVFNVFPSPHNELGDDVAICQLDTTVINGPDTTGLSYTFEWIVADTLFATTQDITVSPLDTTQYFLTVTNEFDCSKTDSIWVNVLPIPDAEISNGDTIMSCLGDSVDLIVEGSGIDSYLWSTGDTTQSIRVSPAISDSTYKYYVDVFNGYDCFISDTLWLTVGTLPGVDLGNDTTLCLGDSITLFGPDTTGLTYTFEWIVADTIFDTTQNIKVSPLDTTQYVIFVSNEDNCTATDSIWINTLDAPIAEIIEADTFYSCLGDSTVFTIEGSGIESYLWSTGDTTASIKVSPIVGDTIYKYYVDVFNESGCSTSDTAWLNVFDVPIIINPFDTISACDGDEVVINIGVDKPLSVQYFIWHYFDNIDTLSTQLRFTPDEPLMVYVQVVTFDNCEVWDSVYVDHMPKPDLVISSDELICVGDTVELSVTGADLYYWTVNGDTISEEPTIEVNPMDTTKYVIIGQMIDGCSAKDSIYVYTYPSPEVELIYDGNNPICQFNEVILKAEGANDYWWTTDETGDSISFFIERDTLVKVFGTNNYGCQSLDSISLVVIPGIEVSFTGLLPAYCDNDPASILVGNPDGGTFTGSGVIGNEFRPILAGNGEHNIKYRFTNSEGCSDSDTVTTKVYGSGEEIDIGPDQIIAPAGLIELDAGEGFDSYYWSTGSKFRNITIHYGDNPPGSVIRYVVIGVINGCTSQGEANITFEDPNGFDENYTSRFIMYPNPNDGRFTISYLEEVNDFEVFVYDYYGKLIHQQKIDCDPDCQSQIDLPDLTKGIYIVKTLSDKGVSSAKFVVH